MKRLTALALFSLTLGTGAPSAFAGFDWLPPAQNPAPMEDYNQAPSMPPVDDYYNAGGVSAPPVTAEPLNTYAAPTSIVPSQTFSAATAPEPRAVPQMQTTKLSPQGGLVINPYPLQAAGSVGGSSYISDQSVHQALAEQSRVLNPLHLGNGMKTGAQPRPAIPPPMRPANADIANMYSDDVMTPMMGGEPAPLPGTASLNNAPVERYAEAVGFGRDLPLALALSQVIPSAYSPSFADGVDAGISVSWEGGKPWDQVLNDMLAPQGLAASVNGNQVIVHPISRL